MVGELVGGGKDPLEAWSSLGGIGGGSPIDDADVLLATGGGGNPSSLGRGGGATEEDLGDVIGGRRDAGGGGKPPCVLFTLTLGGGGNLFVSIAGALEVKLLFLAQELMASGLGRGGAVPVRLGVGDIDSASNVLVGGAAASANRFP